MLDVDTGAIVVERRKVCPIMNAECVREECAWWIATGHCAIAVIAMRMDALITGVPVIRVFEDYEEGGS